MNSSSYTNAETWIHPWISDGHVIVYYERLSN